jgi:hypothetical protein
MADVIVRGDEMTTRTAALAVLAILTVGLGFSRAARAGDSAEVEALIRQGVELREQGRDERALPLFQKAYDLLPSPRTAGQLGLAEMAVGYWVDAEQHLGSALESPDHPWVSKNRRALDDALAKVRQNIGTLVVEGQPAGAAVAVNHRPAGTLPLAAPLRVAKGKALIEVTAPGYAPASQSVQLVGGDQQRVSVSLQKLAVAATEPHPGGEVVAPPPPPPEPKPGGEATGGGGVRRRQVGWGLGIGAGVFLAAAVVETIVWQGKRSDFDSHVGPPAANPQLAQSMWQANCGESEPGRGGSGCSSIYDSMHRAQLLSIVGYVAAGALATGAAVLLFTGNREEAGGGARVACGAAIDPTIVTCRLLF